MLTASPRVLPRCTGRVAGAPAGETDFEKALRQWHADESNPDCVFLKLDDDLDCHDPAKFASAKAFRTFCAIDRLPALVAVARGQVLFKVEFESANSDFSAQLTAALADYPCRGFSCLPELTADYEDAGPVPVVLHIKLPEGRTLKADFHSSTLLEHVFNRIDGVRAGTVGAKTPYVLVSKQPQRTLGRSEADSTLRALGIQNRTLLSVVANPSGHKPKTEEKATTRINHQVPKHDQNNAVPIATSNEQASVSKEGEFGDTLPQTASTKEQSILGGTISTPQLVSETSTRVPTPPAPEQCILQLRMPDGTALRSTFHPDATLAEVRAYVDAHRMDSGGAFVLVSPFPRKTYGPDENCCTLKEEGLVPRSTLLVQVEGNSVQTSSVSDGQRNRVMDAAFSVVGTMRSYLSSFIWGYQGASNDAVEGSPSPQDEDQAPWTRDGIKGHHETQQQASATRGLTSRTIRTLSQQEESEGDDRAGKKGNTYWNGNSVAFDGGQGNDDKQD
jgi:hypothetical protein